MDYRLMDDQPSVEVPSYSGPGPYLALSPHEAQVLRRQLSRALHRGGPVLLQLSSSGGGPRFVRLTVNEREAYDAPASRAAVATYAQPGTTLTLAYGEWRDDPPAPTHPLVDVAHDGQVYEADLSYLSGPVEATP